MGYLKKYDYILLMEPIITGKIKSSNKGWTNKDTGISSVKLVLTMFIPYIASINSKEWSREHPANKELYPTILHILCCYYNKLHLLY